jgi:hypothetical protein
VDAQGKPKDISVNYNPKDGRFGIIKFASGKKKK